jgi:titin
VGVSDSKQELKKPEFLKELKNVEVLEGQQVKLRCKVKGFPQPRISWYKDSTLLRNNRSCRIGKSCS